MAVLTPVGAVPGCLEDLDEPSDADGTGSDEAVDEQVRAYEMAIHERVNEVRREHDVAPLSFDEEIAAVARAYSRDMAERDYFSHESPEGEGPGDRMEAFLPEHCRRIGENLAKVGRRPGDDREAVVERVVSGWMNSPGHRRNVLRESFDEQGIGVATTEDDHVLVTQNFCESNDFGG